MTVSCPESMRGGVLRLRTANINFLQSAETQCNTKQPCSRSPQKSGDHEQSISVIICISIRYKFDLFVVRCPVLFSRFFADAPLDRGCHPERSRRWSEGSGASDSSLTLRMTVRKRQCAGAGRDAYHLEPSQMNTIPAKILAVSCS